MKIKQEFKELIPALTSEEFKQLEDNCLAEGIREKIITWNGFIIDGHNRYEISQKWNLEFETESKHFKDEEDVKEWMILNQLGRRNVTKEQKAYLIGKRYENEKQRVGGQVPKGGGKNFPPVKTAEKLAEELGISDRQVKLNENFAQGVDKLGDELKQVVLQGKANVNKADIQTIAKAEPTFVATTEAEILAKAKEIKQQKAQEKKEKLEAKKEQYQKRVSSVSKNEFKIDINNTKETFRVIYADPAWSYNDKQDTPNLGGAAKHYDTMSISELCKLPVNEISEKNSVLFLWVTSPLLEDAFKVVDAWGFKYKTSFIWDKVKHNMGHYNSVRHEILLVCTKGSCTPDNKKLYNSVQRIERNNNHSEKPIEFLNIIDDLYNYGNKLEMFCREIKKENWYGWGNEI